MDINKYRKLKKRLDDLVLVMLKSKREEKKRLEAELNTVETDIRELTNHGK